MYYDDRSTSVFRSCGRIVMNDRMIGRRWFLQETLVEKMLQVARIAVDAFKTLVQKVGLHLSKENWLQLTQTTQNLFTQSMPFAIQDELYTSLLKRDHARSAPRHETRGGGRSSQTRNGVSERSTTSSGSKQEASGRTTSATGTETGEGRSSSSTAAPTQQQISAEPVDREPGDHDRWEGRSVRSVEDVTKQVVTGCVVQLLLIDFALHTWTEHRDVMPRAAVVQVGFLRWR